jgi:hypothetical protein
LWLACPSALSCAGRADKFYITLALTVLKDAACGANEHDAAT